MAEEGQFADPIADNPESWRNEGVPEDLRGEACLDSIKDFPSLVKSYVHAHKMVGADKVVVPGEAATEDEMNTFFTALGRPKTADEYGVKAPDEMPEGFPYSEDLAKGFTAEAHKLGLTPKQANGIFNWYNNNQVDAFKGQQKEKIEAGQNAELALRKEFGKAYDVKFAAANSLINNYGGDNIDDLKNVVFHDNPKAISFLANVAKEFSEDRLKGKGSGTFGLMSPGEATKEISRLHGDKEFVDAYVNKKNPGHAGAVERMRNLYELQSPEPFK